MRESVLSVLDELEVGERSGDRWGRQGRSINTHPWNPTVCWVRHCRTLSAALPHPLNCSDGYEILLAVMALDEKGNDVEMSTWLHTLAIDLSPP